MAARLTFLGIAIFWLTMNGLLWRSEFGSRGGDMEVPVALVWQKILTTPDASSLTVYQNGERSGYCEVSTGVARQMATVDADNPVPGNLSTRNGYQLHLGGNISFGDFTNRLKFEAHLKFRHLREWEDFYLKISSRQTLLILHASASNALLNLKMASDGGVLEREIPLEKLQQPDAALRALLGNYAGAVLAVVDLPDLENLTVETSPEWTAVRTRARIGKETMPIYQLKTTVLGRDITVDVSTVGEVLRVELPGRVSARIDEWRQK